MGIIKIIDNLFIFLIKAVRKCLNILIGAEKKLSQNEYDEKNQHNIIIQSTKYDMVSSPDEPYYQEQYWHWIKKYLDSEKLSASGNYLDLGCGQGRLSIPLAEWCKAGGEVIGADISEKAIQQAREYTLKAGLDNIEYCVKDILLFLKSQKPESFDAVFCLEVVFFLPEYRSVLEGVKRVLKPKGMMFVSFRSQYFYALNSVDKQNFGDVDVILEKRAGRLSGGDMHFTWQTSNEIRHYIGEELKFEILDLYGIGCCSGIERDPHACVSRPSLLAKEEKDELMKLEIAMANYVPDAGRYILCVARKN